MCRIDDEGRGGGRVVVRNRNDRRSNGSPGETSLSPVPSSFRWLAQTSQRKGSRPWSGMRSKLSPAQRLPPRRRYWRSAVAPAPLAAAVDAQTRFGAWVGPATLGYTGECGRMAVAILLLSKRPLPLPGCPPGLRDTHHRRTLRTTRPTEACTAAFDRRMRRLRLPSRAVDLHHTHQRRRPRHHRPR